MLKDFKQFLLRGNVVDLAIGVVVGASFGTIVTALVNDLINPLISVVAQIPDFSNMAFSVGDSKFLYGHFINTVISFILVASAIFFFVVKPMNLLIKSSKKKAPIDDTKKKCSECLSEIPKAAKRCMYCTHIVD
ncbi:MAG: large conductance mechanosensitive channel [Patescibacteria group bacterium]|nr:large conductance mechanosensitive channel [Patescibacteria group bacterium]